MIDEILEAVEGHGKYHTSSYDGPVMTIAQALTAIYEIGLECIGADEPMATAEFGLDPEEVYMPTDTIRDIRNELRASQRKAWAKACGVAEK